MVLRGVTAFIRTVAEFGERHRGYAEIIGLVLLKAL